MHVLSLALLFAQLGMVVHASTHLKSDSHANPARSQLCGECLSFAPMQSIVGSGATVLLSVSIAHDRAVDSVVVSQVPRRVSTAFRSRAPPFSV